MKQNKALYLILSSFLILLFVFPFLIVTRYTYLAADDFCRATTSFSEFFPNLINWYTHHNGRYFNALISYLPVYDINVYPIVLSLFFISLGCCIYFFVKNTFLYFELSIPYYKCLFISVIFFISLISQLPSIYEFFYWFAGTTAYLLSIILFLLFLIFLFVIKSTSPWNSIFIVFLIIMINGNNEMFIPLINYILLLSLLGKLVFQATLNKKLLLYNLVSWITSLTVILAPGSQNRRSYYSEGGDLFYSIKSSILSSGMFTLKSVLELPYVLLYVGLLLFFIKENTFRKSFSCPVNPIGLFVLSFIGFVLVVFIPYYAVGYLVINSGRIGNMIHMIFWIILFINIVNAGSYLKIATDKNKFLISISSFLFIGIYLIIIGLQNENYQNLVNDFREGTFTEHLHKIENREEFLKGTEKIIITLPRIDGNKTLKHMDISNDMNNWSNECFTDYVNKKNKLRVKSIRVE